MSALTNRLAALSQLGAQHARRESAHTKALQKARLLALSLHKHTARALAEYGTAAANAGAPQLAETQLGEVRLDAKHIRAVEFELQRGVTRAIVVVKSRGEITLVGPFRAGKKEGPCKTFAADAAAEIAAAFGDFLQQFLEAAAQP